MSNSGYPDETEWEKRAEQLYQRLRALDEDLVTRVIAGTLERAVLVSRAIQSRLSKWDFKTFEEIRAEQSAQKKEN